MARPWTYLLSVVLLCTVLVSAKGKDDEGLFALSIRFNLSIFVLIFLYFSVVN